MHAKAAILTSEDRRFPSIHPPEFGFRPRLISMAEKVASSQPAADSRSS
ncbi:MAG: hypothetical protein JWM27_2076 [Gemmatimonadetes bacterium]|nr:hypothetical protein [Gemmatimonadota bacterium]